MRKIDLTGMQFHRLTVLSEAKERKYGKVIWQCRCACGSLVDVAGDSLKTGNTQSCGCQSLENTLSRNTTHGLSKTPEYAVWGSMKARCENTKDGDYANYGARGIHVCPRWSQSFEAFISDMGRRPTHDHSIDRIDNDRGYEPSNCRWATNLQQANNTSRNHRLTIDGETKTIAGWSRRSGLSQSCILLRAQRGVYGRALIAPVRIHKNQGGKHNDPRHA